MMIYICPPLIYELSEDRIILYLCYLVQWLDHDSQKDLSSLIRISVFPNG